MSKVITRFAPSPTGHLHIGGARTALFCWLLARHFKGEFRLRIEDTDTKRSRQECTDSILASMRWLGLDYDGELTYQSKRTAIYNAAIDKLLETGKAYWCACSPEEVDAMRETARAKGEKPKYNGCCRDQGLGAGAGRVVRLRLADSGVVSFNDMVKGQISIDIAELDDMILRRSDGMPTYNLAVVVDDHDMEISHVFRGDDHVPNTPKQILIYQALGWDLPVFGHVPMILGPDRQKLSKRHGARAVVEYEQEGLLPEALINCLVRLGWSHGDQELFTRQELIDLFDGHSLNGSASAFDFERLNWLNAHYLRAKPAPELAELVLPFVVQLGSSPSLEQILPILPLYKERVNNLLELAKDIVLIVNSGEALEYDPAVLKKITPESQTHLQNLSKILADLPSFDHETINQTVQNYLEVNAMKFKQLGPALRLALTGVSGGPSLPEIMEVLGKTASLARLNRLVGWNLSA